MFPFDPPENMRKPLVCDVFKGDEKETLGRKGLRTARVSLTTFASNLHLFHVSRIKYVTNLSALVLTLRFSKKKKEKQIQICFRYPCHASKNMVASWKPSECFFNESFQPAFTFSKSIIEKTRKMCEICCSALTIKILDRRNCLYC